MRYPTYKDAENIIRVLNRRHQMNVVIINRGQLEFALEKPKMFVSNHELYGELYQKAAALMETLTKSHVLSDGNKRFAMLMAELMINANGAELIMPLKTINFSVDTAQDAEDIMTDEIQQWFKVHIAENENQLCLMLEEIMAENSILDSMLKKGKYAEAERLIGKWIAFDSYPEHRATWEELISKWKEKNDENMMPDNTALQNRLDFIDKYHPIDSLYDNAYDTIEDLDLIGHTLQELEAYESKIKEEEKELANTDDNMLLYKKAKVLTKFSKKKESLATYDRIISMWPKEQRAYLCRGIQHNEFGCDKKARKDFEEYKILGGEGSVSILIDRILSQPNQAVRIPKNAIQDYLKRILGYELSIMEDRIKRMKDIIAHNHENNWIVRSKYEKVRPIYAELRDVALRLSNLMIDLHDVYPKEKKGELNAILEFCRDETKFTGYNIALEYAVEFLHKSIRSFSVESTIQHDVKLDDKECMRVTVSADRKVYPMDSVIHVCAKISDIIKGGDVITFEILDSKNRCIASKTESVTCGSPEFGSGRTCQVDFMMKGKEWKIGCTYTIRTVYGSDHAEYTFAIDQRRPVLQSDKSVYMAGGDMIITVIDPDANKDSQVVEYAGDRDDAKLVIESSHGKIDGYRLRKMEESSDVFQGILGILKIRKDGTLAPQEYDGRIMDKTQGKGIDDGFIGGMLGEEITVRYTNKTGTVKCELYISEFDIDERYTTN